MDRSPPLSYEDVRDAAEQLQQRGENVTLDALATIVRPSRRFANSTPSPSPCSSAAVRWSWFALLLLPSQRAWAGDLI